jgi:hypothetical protein
MRSVSGDVERAVDRVGVTNSEPSSRIDSYHPSEWFRLGALDITVRWRRVRLSCFTGRMYSSADASHTAAGEYPDVDEPSASVIGDTGASVTLAERNHRALADGRRLPARQIEPLEQAGAGSGRDGVVIVVVVV